MGWQPVAALPVSSDPGQIEVFGETRAVGDWAKDGRCIVSDELLRSRIAHDWHPEEALTEPLKSHLPRKCMLSAFGKTKAVANRAEDTRCAVMLGTLRKRLRDDTWPWRQSLDAPGCHYARLRARSATYGEVTLIAVDKAGEDRFYLMTLERQIPSTRLLRLWSRYTLIEQVFRTLKSLLATDACRVRNENEYYGHLVLR